MPETATAPAKALPEWISHSTNAKGFPRFALNIDARYPALIEELRAAGYKVPEPLDLYWLGVLGFITRWDARYAIMESGLSKKPNGQLDDIHQTLAGDMSKYGSTLDPGGSGKRGWIETETVEVTPEKPVKKGETITIDGTPHVCIQEEGCNRLRSGQIESGQFRRETFVARSEGAGADQANKDGPEIYEKLRGYKCG